MLIEADDESIVTAPTLFELPILIGIAEEPEEGLPILIPPVAVVPIVTAPVPDVCISTFLPFESIVIPPLVLSPLLIDTAPAAVLPIVIGVTAVPAPILTPPVVVCSPILIATAAVSSVIIPVLEAPP